MKPDRYLYIILVICPYLTLAQIKQDIIVPNKIRIQNIKCFQKNKHCTKEQDYPRITYLKNRLIEKRINNKILKAFNIKDFKALVNQPDCRVEDQISYHISTFKEKILSIEMGQHFLGKGAAHSYNSMSTLNFNLYTGNIIPGKSIFKNDSAATAVKDIILIKAKKQLDSLNASGLLAEVSESIDQWVYSVNSKGFIFYANTSDGGLQYIEIPISHSEIKYLVKEDFYKL